MAEQTAALERARQRALGGSKQKAVKPTAVASVQPTKQQSKRIIQQPDGSRVPEAFYDLTPEQQREFKRLVQEEENLACIDAPETLQGASGKWSTETLKGLIQGKSISLKPQVKDRYGRTVAEIYQGTTNVNLHMVKLGAAFAYRKYLKQCDRDAYLKAETAAMKRKLGVWGSYKVDQNPWDYRRSRRH